MMMSQAIRAVGVLAVLTCIGTAMLMNFLYGRTQGGSPFEGDVLGAVSIAFDVLKVVLAWQMWQFLAQRRWGSALAAGAFAIGLTLWALQSAIGFMAQTRGVVLGGREAVRASMLDAEHELAAATERRRSVVTARVPALVESDINTELLVPVLDGAKVRGSVRLVSDNCARIDKATIEACGRINRWRQELAGAVEATRLDKQIAELHRRIDTLRLKGGNIESNPQASLMSRFLGGWISAADVVMAQSLALPILLELCAAFGLALVLDGTTVRRGLHDMMTAGDRNGSDDGRVTAATPPAPLPAVPVLPAIASPVPPSSEGEPERFLREGLKHEPGASVPRKRLYREYRAWCGRNNLTVTDARSFAERFVAEGAKQNVRWGETNGEPHILGMKLAK